MTKYPDDNITKGGVTLNQKGSKTVLYSSKIYVQIHHNVV